MWKNFLKKRLLKKALKYFLSPLLNLCVDALITLAEKTDNNLDNRIINEIARNKDFIIEFILDNKERLL